MTTAANPALQFRQGIREVCKGFVPPTDIDETTAFQKWLTEAYIEAKQNLFLELAPNNGDSLMLFVSAAGLMTYGDLDKAIDVLDYIPDTRGAIRRVAGIVKVLLPIPENLDPINNVNEVRTWIQENSLNLRWIEDAGRFILSG